MLDLYKTVYRGGEAEIVEKKSRFIATVRLVETEEEALQFIEEMRQVPEADLNYFGIAICGAKKKVNKLTGNMPLLR